MRVRVCATLGMTLLLVGIAHSGGQLPDPQMTPGAVNPDVNQDNLFQTICRMGFTKSIRPPAWYTNRLKKQQIREYGYEDTRPEDYEEDHLIALELGGAPSDPRNLWPQRRDGGGADAKDELEDTLNQLVCQHQLSLSEAQRAIATDWVAAYRRFVQQ